MKPYHLIGHKEDIIPKSPLKEFCEKIGKTSNLLKSLDKSKNNKQLTFYIEKFI